MENQITVDVIDETHVSRLDSIFVKDFRRSGDSVEQRTRSDTACVSCLDPSDPAQSSTWSLSSKLSHSFSPDHLLGNATLCNQVTTLYCFR